MKDLTVKLPDALDRRLSRFVESGQFASKSEVVRQAIEFYLRAQPRTDDRSAAVVARKWIGISHGPADLSVNPACLDDFGK